MCTVFAIRFGPSLYYIKKLSDCESKTVKSILYDKDLNTKDKLDKIHPYFDESKTSSSRLNAFMIASEYAKAENCALEIAD